MLRHIFWYKIFTSSPYVVPVSFCMRLIHISHSMVFNKCCLKTRPWQSCIFHLSLWKPASEPCPEREDMTQLIVVFVLHSFRKTIARVIVLLLLAGQWPGPASSAWPTLGLGSIVQSESNVVQSHVYGEFQSHVYGKDMVQRRRQNYHKDVIGWSY